MKRALLLVDLQNDFFPKGALPVPQGDHVLPAINQLLEKKWDLILASKDWHPEKHLSFAIMHDKKKIGDVVMLGTTPQVLWPVHCVGGTPGAEFAPGWDSSKVQKIVYKGVESSVDSYSAFFDNIRKRDTGLAPFLRENEITSLYCVGLATEYCVLATVLDAVELGFTTYVVREGVEGINLQPGDVEQAFAKMEKQGAHVISLKDLS